MNTFMSYLKLTFLGKKGKSLLGSKTKCDTYQNNCFEKKPS